MVKIYFMVKIYGKKVFTLFFWYLKKFYEGVFVFHKIKLGTKNIANIFICV